MKLDVIIPLYNEEENIEPLYKELTKTLKNIKYTLIFVNDGSIDKSYSVLESIYNKDEKHIKVINFSRNFGKEAAMYAGLKHSKAKYACIIDADLQQSPKYILDMMEFLDNNKEYDEVAMFNDYNDKNVISRLVHKSFYKTMNKSSNLNAKVGASDFRLFRDYVVKSILELPEYNRFSKGIFAWVGFNIYYMNYTPDKRTKGESKFKLRKQLSYAKDGIINFSTKPLKIATILGLIFSVVSFIYIIEILFQTLIVGKDVPGYASIMCVTLLLGGIQLLVLGIIGEYIAKTYIESKRRPVYVTKNILGEDDYIL